MGKRNDLALELSNSAWHDLLSIRAQKPARNILGSAGQVNGGKKIAGGAAAQPAYYIGKDAIPFDQRKVVSCASLANHDERFVNLTDKHNVFHLSHQTPCQCHDLMNEALVNHPALALLETPASQLANRCRPRPALTN